MKIKIRGLDFATVEALAEMVYRLIQDRIEDPELSRLVSLTGGYEEANDYTKRTMCDVVQLVLKGAERYAKKERLPPEPSGDGLREVETVPATPEQQGPDRRRRSKKGKGLG